MKILAAIVERRPAGTAEEDRRKMVLHFDNGSSHIARLMIEYMHHNHLCLAPQPPFSPDLPPSGFYLFGKVKTALMCVVFDDENQLFQAVMTILHEISREELERVFDEWLARLDACIQRDGEYVQ
jgi:hypothetical protein